MKKLCSVILCTLLYTIYVSLLPTSRLQAADNANSNGLDNVFSDIAPDAPQNLFKYSVGASNDPTTGTGEQLGAFAYTVNAPIIIGLMGAQSSDGTPLKTGLIPTTGRYLAMMYQYQPGTKEYVADLLNNIGLPTVSHAYAQGTGYNAMSMFLPFWKVARNLAYSLYIIMFVIVGIMIMLRTKINAQTIITIQSAIPNLIITLILITFSYAIVGFMIDIMYFLIYFIVFLLSSPGINIISTPATAISRLMDNSAWSIVFNNRNSIVGAVSLAISQVLSGVGTGLLSAAGAVGGLLSFFGFGMLIAGIWLAVSMLKLMWTLIKCYFMLLVHTITAPLQILMNAMPGSKAFSTWLRTTASYLLPFPVVASMFIFAAVLIGDPSKATFLQGSNIYGTDNNPFGLNLSNPLYDSYGTVTNGKTSGGNIWLPPFTLTDFHEEPANLMILLGFFIITMTPAAAKMAQDWLQVKESPYTSEIMSTAGPGLAVAGAPVGWFNTAREEARQRKMMEYQARLIGGGISKNQQASDQNQMKK